MNEASHFPNVYTLVWDNTLPKAERRLRILLMPRISDVESKRSRRFNEREREPDVA